MASQRQGSELLQQSMLKADESSFPVAVAGHFPIVLEPQNTSKLEEIQAWQGGEAGPAAASGSLQV
jgi:hypothetical protein